MERTEKTVEINAPISVVFDLFSDFEKFPEWMKHIKEVRQTEPRFTRWTADAPLGINVEWEAETTAFEQNRKIAWQTVRGDVEMKGEVTFEEADDETTRMHVSLGYEPPAGHLGSLLAKFFGTDPEKQIEEELGRFAALAESR
ncbi:MAG TPA: SRPBCC family protein, partial [Pyrinomonadaceae bacterium]|nr:SRPBCC family protein [Pyrinomonadaceae bacterium]